MGLKCRISYSNGVAKVIDNSGNESQLYKDLLAYTGNEAKALDYWVVANDKALMGTGESTAIQEIATYMDSTAASVESLSPAEEFQVVDFMRRTGEHSLDSLNVKLSKIFKANGLFKIDMNEAVNSGLFTQQEIEDIKPEEIQDILLKIEGQLVTKDIIIEPDKQEYQYVDSGSKTIFGTAQKVSQKEFDNDIIRAVDSFTNKESFLTGIQTLPYSDFVQKVQEDEVYAASVMARFKGLKKIPKLSIVGRNISDQNNELYTTIRNTILVNPDGISVEAEIDYLNSIPQAVWDQSNEDVKAVLKEVEQTLADVNLDIIGIADNVHNRDGVMTLLYNANQLLVQASEENLQSFVESHKALIDTPSTIIAQQLEDKYVGLNIVSFYTNRSADYVFNNYGLIEVSENLYHKVDQNASIDVVKDFIYEQFVDGKIEIPSEFIVAKDPKKPVNKPTVLEGISAYLMSRPTTSDITNQELYSAYQVAFEHSPINSKQQSVKGLMEIRTDEKYLKSEFISDFYNYILNEKVKNSVIFKTTLSKFQINDRGIMLTEPIPSIDNLKYKEELEDYIRLHRDSSMKYLVDNTDDIVSEDLLYLNFPEKATEFEGAMIVDGDFIITNPTADNYIQVSGQLYRKEIVRGNANLFVKIVTSKNSTYLTNNLDFSFDREAVNKLFNDYAMLSPTSVNNISFQTTIAKSRLNDNMSQELRELSTLKDKSYLFIEVGDSFVVHKDGKEVGSITYTNKNGVYNNPKVVVAEEHRSKGVGTELYLKLFNKAQNENGVVIPPIEETPQSKNIFSRIEGVITPEVKLQQSAAVDTKTVTPKQITDAVLKKLKATGLAKGVYSMTASQMEAKLRTLGVNPAVSKQITLWHGTSNAMKDISIVDRKNEKRYGKLLGGTYFASKDIASWFSGWIEYQSKLIKANVDESSFITIDMKGTMPSSTRELFDNGIITKDEYRDLVRKKRSGQIKGLILENATEEEVKYPHTQYVAFSPDVIEKVEELDGREAFNQIGVAIGMMDAEVPFQLQTVGVSVTPNGFVYKGEVYLNTDSENLLNTQIHEFGHLFNSWAKENRPDIYSKGIELVQSEEGKEYIDFVKRNQPNLEGEALYEEALTQAIGDKGAKFSEKSMRDNFTEWLRELWNSISSAIGVVDMTADELSSLTLEEFAQAVSVDLLKGDSNQFQDSLERVIGDSGVSIKDAIKMNNGNPMEMTPNGERSKLYNDILSLPGIDGNRVKAAEYKAMVYSDNFKSWFGDWQSTSSDKSTVVDENGEPLLVYHGGPEVIRIFDEDRAGETTANNDHGAFYFSNEYNVAEDYGEQSIIRRFEGQSKEDLIEYYDLTEEQADEVIDDLYEYAAKVSVVHPVFLNMRKPMVVKYEGADINIEKAQREIGFVKNQEDTEYEFTDEYIEFDESQLEDYESEIQDKMEDGYSRDEAVEQIRDEYGLYGELVELDGLIMRDVVDNIGDKSGIIQDEYVAITPSQIKSVFNEGTFSEYRDEIVYQVGQKELQTYSSVEESIENTSSIFDSQLELVDLYSSKEEAQIKKDIDCG